jgi:hypothetical protein
VASVNSVPVSRSGLAGLGGIELRQGSPTLQGPGGTNGQPEQPATVSLKRHAQLGAPTAIRTAWSAYALFLNYFDLFIDHLPGEAIDCIVRSSVEVRL